MRTLKTLFALLLWAGLAQADVVCSGSAYVCGSTAINTINQTFTGVVTFDNAANTPALFVDGLDLGATDTTLSRSAAGKLAVEGVDVAYDNSFTSITIIEDFQAGSTATTTAASFGLSTTAIATGTGGGATGILALTGAMRFNSHATNDNSGFIAAIGSQNVFGSVSSATVWTSTNWSIDVVFKPGSNSTAITNIGMFIGLAAAFNSDPMGGTGSIGVRFDSDRTDATFIFVTCDSSTSGCASNGDDTNQKVVASSITPVAGTNYRFRIRRAASGVGGNPTIYMRVNDETEKTFCSSGCDDVATEVPDGTIGLAPVVSYLTRTTTGVLSGDFDYWALRIPNIPARY